MLGLIGKFRKSLMNMFLARPAIKHHRPLTNTDTVELTTLIKELPQRLLKVLTQIMQKLITHSITILLIDLTKGRDLQS